MASAAVNLATVAITPRWLSRTDWILMAWQVQTSFRSCGGRVARYRFTLRRRTAVARSSAPSSPPSAMITQPIQIQFTSGL